MTSSTYDYEDEVLDKVLEETLALQPLQYKM
jgi:hypothetical protein